MPVTTTGNDLINSALSKSSKNEPSGFSPAEQVRRVNDAFQGAYQVAARVHPGFFGSLTIIAESAGTWARPEEALSIARIENGAEAEIVVVPFNDRQAEPSKLSTYEWGQLFTAITNAAGTPAGALTFFTSDRPTLINALVDIVSLDWREDFNELLALQIAMEFSAKDGRDAEAVTFAQERNQWLGRFAQFLQHSTGNLRRRFGSLQVINLDELIPLMGGSK